MGGKAELSLENAEEPFLGGIKFFAVPPTKRYRDMDMLSGGEKTVAALSLLFAIHTCGSSASLIAREIDSPSQRSHTGACPTLVMSPFVTCYCALTGSVAAFVCRQDSMVDGKL